MTKMTTPIALEHTRDGADCMVDGDKIVKRLMKAFPDQSERLTKASEFMKQARTLLCEVESDLTRSASKF